MSETIALAAFWGAVVLLLYAYAGYPLVLTALTVLLPRREEHGDFEPRVSLLIPAYNEADVIQAKLRNALALDYPPEKLDILVGNDCSDDDTVALAREFESRGVQVHSFPQRRGKASVMNDLVRLAEGEVLLLCDANVMFRPDALRQLLARLHDPRVGAVTGDVRLASHECSFGQGEGHYYRLERRLQVAESRVGSLMGVDGGMYVLRNELFRPLPADTILDDFVISMQVIRQGKRVVYEPSAVADENATPLARSEFRRRVRVSAGALQSVRRGNFPQPWRVVEHWQYLSHKLLRWVIPLLLLVLLAANILLWESSLAYQLLLGGQALVYLLAAFAAVSLRVRETRVGGTAFYFVMSFVAMVVGVAKGLLTKQSGTWRKTERQALAGRAGTE